MNCAILLAEVVKDESESVKILCDIGSVSYTHLQKKSRSKEQEALIRQAKELLMNRNNMSEEEAHRYLQKSSMDSGTNMVETAEMVLSVMS